MPEISSFYTSVPKIMIIFYTIPEIWRRMDVIFSFHFGLFFALLTPLQSEKSKLKKKMKIKRPEISSFYPCVPKFMFTWCIQKLWSQGVRFLRYDTQETDGQKKWNIGVGAPPKNHKTKTQYLFNRHCFLRQNKRRARFIHFLIKYGAK